MLRRHRLIEQFLVQVLGMNWSEVHEEAERLEHAVSERLIDRIDEMLGRPAVDPHGDPIPGPEGELQAQSVSGSADVPRSTRRCSSPASPIRTPKFLRFIEQRNLKPGQRIAIVIAGSRLGQRHSPQRETGSGPRSAPGPPPKSSSSLTDHIRYDD